MKRRIVSLLLCFALGTVLMACGGGKETTDTDNTTEAESESDDTATVSSSSEEESKYTEIDPWEYLWGYFSENEDGTYKYNGYPLAFTKEGLDDATTFSYLYYGDSGAVAADENLLIELEGFEDDGTIELRDFGLFQLKDGVETQKRISVTDEIGTVLSYEEVANDEALLEKIKNTGMMDKSGNTTVQGIQPTPEDDPFFEAEGPFTGTGFVLYEYKQEADQNGLQEGDAGYVEPGTNKWTSEFDVVKKGDGSYLIIIHGDSNTLYSIWSASGEQMKTLLDYKDKDEFN